MKSETTVRRAYPVAPPAVVTATVITEVPNGAGTVAEKAPPASAVDRDHGGGAAGVGGGGGDVDRRARASWSP